MVHINPKVNFGFPSVMSSFLMLTSFTCHGKRKTQTKLNTCHKCMLHYTDATIKDALLTSQVYTVEFFQFSRVERNCILAVSSTPGITLSHPRRAEKMPQLSLHRQIRSLCQIPLPSARLRAGNDNKNTMN